jgi:hypothetical protein
MTETVTPAPTRPAFTSNRPADPNGPVPRILDPHERAYRGTRRFKIRVAGNPEAPILYVLARDEASARSCYLKATGLPDPLVSADNGGGMPGVGPNVLIRELDD